jgi:NADH-quinone oxidoreductase subunit M
VWPWAAAIALGGILVTAGLYLRAIQTTFLGPPSDRWTAIADLGLADGLAVVPLLALIVVVGVAPGFILDLIHATVTAIMR